jgi:endonuclease/exonuclease/phosphatase family metal-dependent hydrolase
MKIKLATYNIHACIGTDGCFDPDRIVKVLLQMDADVVALQEVEHHRVGNLDLLEYLAAQTGLKAIAGPTLLRDSRHYGNALLTRLPVISLKQIDLSMPGREARGALDVIFDFDGQRLQVIATHLGLNPHERRRQVRQLLSILAASPADVSVLMGDLNEWFLWGRILRWLRSHFSETPHIATFPSAWPILALDRIWGNPRGVLDKIASHRSPLARVASDHLPLTVQLSTNPQRQLKRTGNSG